jgi:anti-anti-sigma regulatory factor
MIQMKHDKALNLFKIIFSQKVDHAEAKEYREKIEAMSPDLQPGFRVFVDLSQLEQMDSACASEIRAVMDLFQKIGVSKIVRVIPDPHKDIGFKLMSKFHYGHDVPILTCETLEEGLEKLAVKVSG